VFVLEPYPYAGIGAARTAGFDEYMLGSVASNVLSLSTVPVLIVK
jgi:nucleotide-binding universal stress UspA family protein